MDWESQEPRGERKKGVDPITDERRCGSDIRGYVCFACRATKGGYAEFQGRVSLAWREMDMGIY